MEHEQMGKDTETEAVEVEGEGGEGERGRRKGTVAGRQAGRSSRWRPHMHAATTTPRWALCTRVSSVVAITLKK